MVIVSDYMEKVNSTSGQTFVILELSGGLELVQSQNTGKFYATSDVTSLETNASPLTIKPKIDIFSDEKSTIFMSSKNDQVSNWYPEMQHGLFTYLFLKGLKGIADLNTDGKITLQEMETYLNDPNEGIPYISNKDFQRPQEAQIIGNKQSVLILN